MKWGVFDAETKSTGERGSGRIYKNVEEFTKNMAEFTKKCIRGRFALAEMGQIL